MGKGKKWEKFDINQPLNDILGEERDYSCMHNFHPGFLWDIGWNWIRILKHLIIPSSGLQGFCDEMELHSKNCPIRWGCSCNGVTLYRNQYIQRLQ